MIFQFIKYINPTWYFNLPSSGKNNYFPDYDHLSTIDRSIIQIDERYSSWPVSKLDAAYQAWHKGFIADNEDSQSLDFFHIKPTLKDNYRFIRKYFHPLWSWYILVLRLIAFNNPISEIAAWLSSYKIKRVMLYDQVYPHDKRYVEYVSELVHTQPKVSIIIPTLNRYTYLADVLHDLEKQDYRNFEVIIVDQSEPFQADFYKPFQLNLQVIRQSEKALWLARNTAIKTSDAEYLLLFDDDSRVEPDWISQHLKALDYFQADISSGVSISLVGAKVPTNYSFFRWGDQVDTGNVLIHRRIFEKVGLFDRQFEKQRMGDGEFGLRAYLAGFKNISNPHAKRLHLKVSEGGLRQMGSWDAYRPKSWWEPRPVPSVLYFYRKYFPLRQFIFELIKNIPLSIVPYRYKRNNLLIIIGALISIFILPLLFIQVFKSWIASNRMLSNGPFIELIKKHDDLF